MTDELMSDLASSAVPSPEGTDSQQPLAFSGKIDFGVLYHQIFTGMQRLHGTNQDERARELFYDSIGHFACLWDAEFVRGFVDIQECFEGDLVSQYRLHIPEFSRLMQRSGIAPKPDVKLVVRPEWEVPATLSDLNEKQQDPSYDDVDPREDDIDPYDEGDVYE